MKHNPQEKNHSIYTIGHSTRPVDEFLQILHHYGMEVLVDVRTVPGSRHNPQYNQEALASSLAEAGIEYLHMKGLGGLRHARNDSQNRGFRNASFRGYADYMQTPEFDENLDRLITTLRDRPTVIMCAEAVPWRCHRSLIGDALAVRGISVYDILDLGEVRAHKLTDWAEVAGTKIVYP